MEGIMLSDLIEFEKKQLFKDNKGKQNIQKIIISNFPYQIFKDGKWNEDILKEDFYVENKNFILEERIKEFYASSDEDKIGNILNTHLLYCRDINREDLLLDLLKKK
jgi:hypothetical protein